MRFMQFLIKAGNCLKCLNCFCEVNAMEEILHEFLIIVDETNEVLTLLLSKDEIDKVTKDPNLLATLVAKKSENSAKAPAELTPETLISDHCEEDENSASALTKGFLWPDAAVYLLLELYREKEMDFTSEMKRNYVIWSEIASKMIDNSNGKYNVTGQQCSVKLSGLKRTYKNIIDQNKKSGNCRNSWAFFSVMDSIFGKKAYIIPSAIASSEGPAQPTLSMSPESTTSSSSSSSSLNPNKKRKVEIVLESFIKDIKEERKERRMKRETERKELQKLKEERYTKRKEEREQMHKEKLEVQKSVVDILKELVAKSK